MSLSLCYISPTGIRVYSILCARYLKLFFFEVSLLKISMLHTEPAYVQTAKSAFNFLVFSVFLLVYITPNDPPESI